MIDVTQTNTELLASLHDSEDEKAWSQFDARYRPIITGFARRLGLSDADAADVAQDTMLRFISEYREGKYDRNLGRLRSWLIGIARNRVLAMRRSSAIRKEARGESAIVDLDNDAQLTQLWDEERRGVHLRLAMAELKQTRIAEKTLKAFELLVTKQLPASAVAESLGMSTHDVYLAKSRCTQKLRELIAEMDAAMDGESR